MAMESITKKRKIAEEKRKFNIQLRKIFCVRVIWQYNMSYM